MQFLLVYFPVRQLMLAISSTPPIGVPLSHSGKRMKSPAVQVSKILLVVQLDAVPDLVARVIGTRGVNFRFLRWNGNL